MANVNKVILIGRLGNTPELRYTTANHAVAELRIAVDKGSGPDLAAFHNDLGVALARQGHREEATQHFREALRVDPGPAAAQANLAKALGPGR